MPDRKDIEDQDLENLREVEEETAALRDELAETTIREENAKSRIKQLEQHLADVRGRKEEILSEIREADQRGRELARELRQKYGEGKFDLESGTFIEETSE